MDEGRAVRMIAADLDGTLLDAEGVVRERTLAALHAAAESGIRIVVATGRRHCYAMRALRELGLRGDQVMVSSNGAVVRQLDATLLDRTLLEREAAERLCAHMGDLRNALVMTFDCVGADGQDARGSLVVEHLDELNGSIARWVAANEPYIVRVQPIERAFADRLPIQMMLCGTVERMREAERRLRELPGVAAPEHAYEETAAERETCRITLHRTEYPERDLSILDILPAGCSKGNALLRLGKGWGIAAEEMMALGDNWNDLSMLRAVGRPVLMGNAPEELRSMAEREGWRVTSSHVEDGAAAAIEGALETAAALR